MSWDNAYLDLNDALARARHGCGSQIWVAAGTYLPQSTSQPFSLVSGVPVYGGFAGYETSIEQRDLYNPANETILNGLVGGNNATYVVTATNANSATILDGFTVIEASTAGINISGGSPIIRNCRVHHNQDYYGAGILSGNANVRVERCTVSDNAGKGIAFSNGSPRTVNIFNNVIHHNGDTGIDIWENYYPGTSQLNIRNNTIINNAGRGVDSLIVLASVTNCIVQNNQAGDVYNCTVSYSLLTGGGDPCFVAAEANNFHLKTESLCIDRGKPNSTDSNELDIDGETRAMDGDANGTSIVDMGADEFYQPRADYNDDGIVNFIDFAMFALPWRMTDANISLDGDNDVDMNDLELFCDVWLWTGPWMDEYQQMMCMGGGEGQSQMMLPAGQELFMAEALESAPLQADVLTIPEPPPSVEDIIVWLDATWNAGDFAGVMTYDEYLAFRKLLEEQMQ